MARRAAEERAESYFPQIFIPPTILRISFSTCVRDARLLGSEDESRSRVLCVYVRAVPTGRPRGAPSRLAAGASGGTKPNQREERDREEGIRRRRRTRERACQQAKPKTFRLLGVDPPTECPRRARLGPSFPLLPPTRPLSSNGGLARQGRRSIHYICECCPSCGVSCLCISRCVCCAFFFPTLSS